MAFTEDYYKTTNSLNAPEHPLFLLTIDHPDLPEPVRVVNDTDDLLSNGNTFQALPFRLQLPDDPEFGKSKARLAIDNVGRTLTEWLETSRGGTGATVLIQVVLRSDPDTIQYDTSMDLTNITMTNEEVSGVLSYEDILNKPGLVLTYSPATSPGLY